MEFVKKIEIPIMLAISNLGSSFLLFDDLPVDRVKLVVRIQKLKRRIVGFFGSHQNLHLGALEESRMTHKNVFNRDNLVVLPLSR